jgi:uncharacterized small protein (DUF1192 family)
MTTRRTLASRWVPAVRNYNERRGDMGELIVPSVWDGRFALKEVATLRERVDVIEHEIAALKAQGGEPPAPNSASLAIALLQECADEPVPLTSAIAALRLRRKVQDFLAAQRQA